MLERTRDCNISKWINSKCFWQRFSTDWNGNLWDFESQHELQNSWNVFGNETKFLFQRKDKIVTLQCKRQWCQEVAGSISLVRADEEGPGTTKG